MVLGKKRPVAGEEVDLKMKKKKKTHEEDEIGRVSDERGFLKLDDNLLFEVFKHVDPRTLAVAACVSKQWQKTAEDERLWEQICTRHWNNIGCGNQQLRSVVLALGGFRRLHSLVIWPLSKPPPSSSAPSSLSTAPTSSWAPFPPMIRSKQPTRWGKDEVHLSLSLLSIRYYEKMNFNNRGK